MHFNDYIKNIIPDIVFIESYSTSDFDDPNNIIYRSIKGISYQYHSIPNYINIYNLDINTLIKICKHKFCPSTPTILQSISLFNFYNELIFDKKESKFNVTLEFDHNFVNDIDNFNSFKLNNFYNLDIRCNLFFYHEDYAIDDEQEIIVWDFHEKRVSITLTISDVNHEAYHNVREFYNNELSKMIDYRIFTLKNIHELKTLIKMIKI